MAPAAARPAAPPLLRAPLVLALLAIGTAVVFLSFMWSATGGRFVPQVVDLYLVCQYAKAFAEGHPFQYYVGDPATTGATSLLHTMILGVAHRAGIRGEGLVAFAILTGAAMLVASTEMARRLGAMLGGERTGWLAGALVALGGPVAWGYMYGSDIALFSMLALWLLLELAGGWPVVRVGRVALVGALIALSRPEGLPIAIALGAASIVAPGRRRDVAGRALAWAPLAAALAVLALYRALTGAWLGTSVADKSLVATYGVPEALGLVTEFLVDVVRGLLLGFYPSQTPIGFGRGMASLFFPPLGLVFVLLALVSTRVWAVRFWAATVAIVCVLVAPNMFMGSHFNRYILWAFPGLLVLVAAGVDRLSTLVARGDVRLDRALFVSMAAVFVALGALSTLRFGVTYGDLAGQIARRDLVAAEWIKRQLPPGTAIANGATSVEYLTGHRSVNLHGVTTASFLGNRPAEREAGVLESLARLPQNERPRLLMTTEAALSGSPALRELTDGPPLFATSSFSDEILIFKLQYGLLDGNDAPRSEGSLAALEGRTPVDRLNVCDARDEAAHGYEYDSRVGNVRLAGTARIDSYAPAVSPAPGKLADGGRAVRGFERFSVATTPGRDLVILMRTAGAVKANVWTAAGATAYGLDFSEGVIALYANGRQQGVVTFRPREGWDELQLRVNARDVVGPRTRIELRGRYASFRYWFYQ